MSSPSIAGLPGPRRLPALGNAHQLRTERLHLILERWAARYGPIYRMDMGPFPVVVISDRDTTNAVLRRRPDGFRRWKAIGDVFAEMGIDGVFNAEGDAWRRQRRLSVTALNADYLHRYYDVIAVSMERLRGRVAAIAERGQPVNIHPVFQAFTIDVTSGLAFGQDVNSLERGEDALMGHINTIFAAIARRINAPVPYWRRVKLPADRALDRSLAALQTSVGQFIGESRSRLAERPGGPPENFLEGMLSAPDNFTDSEIVGNVLTMLLAGEDTTSHSLAWAVWYVANRPDVQQRLQAEADAVLGDAAVPDYAASGRLVYAEAVLREAIRLRSPASFLLVEPVQDTEVLEVPLPAGTRMILLTRQITLQEGTYPRAHMFDPDRWLAGGADGKGADSKGYLAFGAGPRVCPGRNLAHLEAKSALAMLARSFEIAPDRSAPAPRERFGFTTGPTAVPVLFRTRTRGQPGVTEPASGTHGTSTRTTSPSEGNRLGEQAGT